MNAVARVLTGLVALSHVGILVLEMFFWDHPVGRRIFGMTPAVSASSAVLAANQGLYNGFLAAGLGWGLWADRGDVTLFFLGCVVVAEHGKISGIFTERDVLLRVGEKAAEYGDRPVSEFMTSKVDALPPAAKIAFAVHRMDQGGYRHVPIVNDQGEAAGIFSVRDILNYLTRKLAKA